MQTIQMGNMSVVNVSLLVILKPFHKISVRAYPVRWKLRDSGLQRINKRVPDIVRTAFAEDTGSSQSIREQFPYQLVVHSRSHTDAHFPAVAKKFILRR